MKASALNDFSDIGFVFIDLKENYSKLDKELQEDVQWLERAVRRIYTSHKELEPQIEELFPKLFSLRIKALNRMADQGENLHDLIDEMLPMIEQLGTNTQLKKLAMNISKVVACNRKLVTFLASTGQLSKEHVNELSNLDYKAFIVILQYMPSQIRRVVTELTTSSLSIEFLSLAAIMMNENKSEAPGDMILQFTEYSKNITDQYIGLTERLLNFAQQENLSNERNDWMNLGLMNMSKGYSDDEPDISHLKLREPNPDYNPD